MIPDTTSAVVAFLLLVAPGVAFQLLRAGTRPESDHTSFREVSLVALTSLFFSGLSVVVLAVLRAVRSGWMPDPGAWLADPNAYVDEHYRLVGRTALVELSVALALAVLVHRLLESNRLRALGRRLTEFLYGRNRTIVPTSAWYQVFSGQSAEEVVYVTVETTSGIAYTGSVVSYSVDSGNPAEREIVLGPPFRLDGPEATSDLEGWQRVIVPGSQVTAILAAYAPRTVTE